MIAETSLACAPDGQGTPAFPSAPPRALDPSLPAVPDDREALFQEFQPLVRKLIRQYGEDPELRQDLQGEIYCRFHTLVQSFDPERGVPLRPYLVRSLTAAIYTYSRGHWRRHQRETNLEETHAADETFFALDPTEEWGRRLILQEVLHRLPRAIAVLPARQRQVVIWRYYEGRSFEEMSELLRVRPATARSLLRHGLNNLRRRMVEAE